MNARWMLLPLTLTFLSGCKKADSVPPKPKEATKLKEVTNSIGMKLVLIPKGKFIMGSPPDEVGSSDDERQHEVTISRDYYLGVYEVTQSQYQQVMGKNPSSFQGQEFAERHPKTGRIIKDFDSSNHPVDTVSWDDAVKFCQRLSELPEEKKVGRVYRLPTEAEWEYACRAGSNSAYSFGASIDSLGDYAWFNQNSANKTHPVGQKKPNAWGLYDMHGNVVEWCSDWYESAYYAQSPKNDPQGPSLGYLRAQRGGRFNVTPEYCRSADRHFISPEFRNGDLGFRVSADPSAND